MSRWAWSDPCVVVRFDASQSWLALSLGQAFNDEFLQWCCAKRDAGHDIDVSTSTFQALHERFANSVVVHDGPHVAVQHIDVDVHIFPSHVVRHECFESLLYANPCAPPNWCTTVSARCVQACEASMDASVSTPAHSPSPTMKLDRALRRFVRHEPQACQDAMAHWLDDEESLELIDMGALVTDAHAAQEPSQIHLDVPQPLVRAAMQRFFHKLPQNLYNTLGPQLGNCNMVKFIPWVAQLGPTPVPRRVQTALVVDMLRVCGLTPGPAKWASIREDMQRRCKSTLAHPCLNQPLEMRASVDSKYVWEHMGHPENKHTVPTTDFKLFVHQYMRYPGTGELVDSLRDVLRRGENVIMYGVSGAGKTCTLLQYACEHWSLYFDMLGINGKIPQFPGTELRDIVDTVPTFTHLRNRPIKDHNVLHQRVTHVVCGCLLVMLDAQEAGLTPREFLEAQLYVPDLMKYAIQHMRKYCADEGFGPCQWFNSIDATRKPAVLFDEVQILLDDFPHFVGVHNDGVERTAASHVVAAVLSKDYGKLELTGAVAGTNTRLQHMKNLMSAVAQIEKGDDDEAAPTLRPAHEFYTFHYLGGGHEDDVQGATSCVNYRLNGVHVLLQHVFRPDALPPNMEFYCSQLAGRARTSHYFVNVVIKRLCNDPDGALDLGDVFRTELEKMFMTQSNRFSRIALAKSWMPYLEKTTSMDKFQAAIDLLRCAILRLPLERHDAMSNGTGGNTMDDVVQELVHNGVGFIFVRGAPSHKLIVTTVEPLVISSFAAACASPGVFQRVAKAFTNPRGLHNQQHNGILIEFVVALRVFADMTRGCTLAKLSCWEYMDIPNIEDAYARPCGLLLDRHITPDLCRGSWVVLPHNVVRPDIVVILKGRIVALVGCKSTADNTLPSEQSAENRCTSTAPWLYKHANDTYLAHRRALTPFINSRVSSIALNVDDTHADMRETIGDWPTHLQFEGRDIQHYRLQCGWNMLGLQAFSELRRVDQSVLVIDANDVYSKRKSDLERLMKDTWPRIRTRGVVLKGMLDFAVERHKLTCARGHAGYTDRTGRCWHMGCPTHVTQRGILLTRVKDALPDAQTCMMTPRDMQCLLERDRTTCSCGHVNYADIFGRCWHTECSEIMNDNTPKKRKRS